MKPGYEERSSTSHPHELQGEYHLWGYNTDDDIYKPWQRNKSIYSNESMWQQALWIIKLYRLALAGCVCNLKRLV